MFKTKTYALTADFYTPIAQINQRFSHKNLRIYKNNFHRQDVPSLSVVILIH